MGWAWALAVTGGRVGTRRAIQTLFLVTPARVPVAARGPVEGHRRAVIRIFVLALVVAGRFTLRPGA